MLCLYFFRTPPFSSDEESEEEETDEEEEEHPHIQQRGKSPQPRLNQATPLQSRTSKTPTVQARQAAVRQSFSTSPQQAQVSVGSVTKTGLTKIESDEEEEEDEEDEWSDVSELQEIDPRQLQSHKDQNGNVNKKNFGKGEWISSQTSSSA